MSEKYELRIGKMGSTEPTLVLFGDSRGVNPTMPSKLFLQALDGWNTPGYMSRITVPDPNGGTYVDPFGRLESKIITVNWSIFSNKGFEAWKMMQEVQELLQSEEFIQMTLITEFDKFMKVTEVLDDCYVVQAPTNEKRKNEQRFMMVLGSKNTGFTSTTIEDNTPQAGEEGYQGITDGEVGVGLQEGQIWDAETKTWVTPTAEPQPGEVGYQGQTDGEVGTGAQSGMIWDANSQTWVIIENPPTEGGPRIEKPEGRVPGIDYTEYPSTVFDGKYYTLNVDDSRNVQSPWYSFNYDWNNPASTYWHDPTSSYYRTEEEWIYEPTGGPFNFYYTNYPDDPRNFNSPSYNPSNDPNNYNHSSFNVGYVYPRNF
jgi:hypothetical protein